MSCSLLSSNVLLWAHGLQKAESVGAGRVGGHGGQLRSRCYQRTTPRPPQNCKKTDDLKSRQYERSVCGPPMASLAHGQRGLWLAGTRRIDWLVPALALQSWADRLTASRTGRWRFFLAPRTTPGAHQRCSPPSGRLFPSPRYRHAAPVS